MPRRQYVANLTRWLACDRIAFNAEPPPVIICVWSAVADVEAVLYACWDALDSGGPSQSTSIGRSHWILLLVRLQHDLYRSVPTYALPGGHYRLLD